MKPDGNISLQILSKQFWQPTLDLCTIIESLELELINILCKLKKPKEEIFKKKRKYRDFKEEENKLDV